MIESALLNDKYLVKDNKILQVGPGEDTLEMQLTAIEQEGKCSCFSNQDKSVLYSCRKCPYRFKCKKGISINKGQLEYQHGRFHKIILLANSKLAINSSLNAVLPLLQSDGKLILFISEKSKISYNAKYCFNSDEIIPLINTCALDILSINRLKIDGENILCLVTARS